MSVLRHRLAVAGALVLALSAAGCSNSGAPSTSAPAASGGAGSSAADSTAFPLEYKHDLGTATIKEKPKNIVSTSVVLTGSLLAIDAPVKGSGAAQPNEVGFDDQGFFSHWSKVAKEKGVKPLYTKSTLDLEAVTAAAPDLIVMATSGGDSTKDQYEQLSKIAPTVSINYLKKSWQEVEKELGTITGNTAQAQQIVADYKKQVGELKAKTAAPTEPVQAAVFQGDHGAALMLPGSAQNEVFTDLGFTLKPTDTAKAEQSEGGNRNDVAFFSVENAVAAITAKTLLLVDADEKTAQAYKSTAGFSTTPPAQAGGKIVPLGHSSFKMDYYSALELAKTLQAAFPKN